MSSKGLHVVALGCPKSRVDAETVVALVGASGYRLVDSPGEAEVVLVTTCAFVSEAASESIEQILWLAREKREGARLVVAGCLPQRYGDELASVLSEADFLVGTGDLGAVADAVRGEGPRARLGGPGSDTAKPPPRMPSLHPGSAYLKVSDGCSRKCAFCTIPSIRGALRSRPIDELCDEARELARRGVVELNLVAQDLSSFGRDRAGGEALPELLEALAQVDGIRWIRPLYLYPEPSLRRVFAAMARTPKVVPYVDLPVQHASNRVLRRMKRGAGAQATRRLIAAARRTIPDLWIRTTIIVGHPGEGANDFETLVDFVRWGRFEHLGVFRYSPEEGTASAAQSDPVSKRDSYNRMRRLMSVQRRVSRARYRALRGKVFPVLVQGPSEEAPLVHVGRLPGQAPEVDGLVYLDRPVQPGTIVQVQVTQTSDYDVYGEVLEG